MRVSIGDALEIHAPIVIGVSFGGFVTQAHATRHPEHPRALVLCNTAARFRVDRSLDAFERLGGREARDAAAGYLQRASAETSARLRPRVYAALQPAAVIPAPGRLPQRDRRARHRP